MTGNEVYKTSGTFFQALDGAPFNQESVLKSQQDKDAIETCMLWALSRMDASEYHAERVARSLDVTEGMVDMMKEHHTGDERSVERRTGVIFPVRHAVYELDAFLAACRSAIDFVAQLLAKYITGVGHVRSITSLRDLFKKHSTDMPFGEFLGGWDEWIGDLKEYRDECVHMMVLQTRAGVEVVSRAGQVTVSFRPVVIPSKPPDPLPFDTRALRHTASDDMRQYRQTVTILEIDGVSERQETYEPAPGYVRVEEFCNSHLENLFRFIDEAIMTVRDHNFAISKLPHKQHGKARVSTDAQPKAQAGGELRTGASGATDNPLGREEDSSGKR